MWHCAQTATKSRLSIFLNSMGGSSGPFLYSSPVFIEATCWAAGPWHISQLIPVSRNSRLSGSKPPPFVLRNWLVWQTAQTAWELGAPARFSHKCKSPRVRLLALRTDRVIHRVSVPLAVGFKDIEVMFAVAEFHAREWEALLAVNDLQFSVLISWFVAGEKLIVLPEIADHILGRVD